MPLNSAIGQALAPIALIGHTNARPQGKRIALNNNMGMTYQTTEKHLTNLREYFVGVVKLAFYCYNNCFLLRVFTNWTPKNS
jgi:hypothetical protein